MYTKDELEKLPIPELMEIANELGIKVSQNDELETVIYAILDKAAENSAAGVPTPKRKRTRIAKNDSKVYTVTGAEGENLDAKPKKKKSTKKPSLDSLFAEQEAAEQAAAEQTAAQPVVDGTVVDGSAVDTTLALLRSLAESISDHVYELSTEQRKYLHLAAVFACNFANHCYALSADVLAQVGLPFDVMLPLIDETARKVHELHPLDAQTGPAVRYDENVMQAQQQLLGDPLMRDIYQKMSQSIHQRANENHDQLRLTEDTGHRV